MGQNKNTIVGILVTLIIVVAIVAYNNRDTLFRNEVEITYSDGCVEKYVKAELVTPECTHGRELANMKGEYTALNTCDSK